MIFALTWLYSLMPAIHSTASEAAQARDEPSRFCSVLMMASLIFLPAAVPAQNPAQTNEEIMQQISKIILDGSKRGAAGEFDAAQLLFNQALEMSEKHFGPDDTWAALSLDYLGENYINKGEFTKAESLLRRSVKIFEKEPEMAPPSYAKALHDLAVVYDFLGDFSRAQPLYDQALAIREAVFGPDHPQVAQSLNFLGNVYLAKADYTRAAQLFERALIINQKKYPPEHPRVTALLNNLAQVYESQGDRAKAEEYLKRAIASAEKRPDPENLDLANYLNNLGSLYRLDDTKKARPLLNRTLAIREKLLGPNDPDIATTLNNLAMVDWQDGDLKQAEQRLLRGLAILQQAFGPAHPSVSRLLANLALLYAAKGETKRAISLLTEGSDNSERNLLLTLATGSEEQKRLYMASIADGTSAMVSLHLKSIPDDTQAARLALTTILRRKGRVLDVMSGQVAALMGQTDRESQGVMTRLVAARAQLSSLVLKGSNDDDAQYKAKMEGLQSQIQTLEKAVSEKATAAGASSGPVTLEAVQSAIPASGALIEMVQYRPFTITAAATPRWDAPRYAAYILKHTGAPSWVELGDAAKIDLDSARLRAALRNPRRTDFNTLARTVDDEVMRPIRKLLGNIQQVFISPDGALNLVPCAALIDEQNHYLVENYTFTYLTSGRDLLRLRDHLPSKQGPVIIANALFELPGKANPTPTVKEPDSPAKVLRSANFGESFVPLEGTSEEAREVSGILKGAQVFTGAQATESVVKQVKAPSIMHIATHGFFLQKQTSSNAATNAGQARGPLNGSGALMAENALLRSGLALSGANGLDDGHGEDGILTALEAAGLDLHGTKLVVLSACETGVGEVQNGEGVYGLRRALVLAGAESQMISLWKVDDDATRELMIDFYRKLQSGVGRAEALRQVQLKLLKSEDHNHPFFWAGFILSGQSGPL
jgi:CHAT domain-containing protein/Tfp pilus assembly protein PilF